MSWREKALKTLDALCKLAKLVLLVKELFS